VTVASLPARRKRNGRAALLAAAVAACLCGCGEDASPHSAAAATTTTAQGCPQNAMQELDGGFMRVPAGARAGRTPLLVLVIPGGRGDRHDVLGVARAAGREGFAVLYPTIEGGGFWTLNRRQGAAQVRDVGALLQRVLVSGCFDEQRISIAGVSNGAGFAARMSCEQPARFAALVAVAAGYRALDPCPADARASFLAIHGSADTVVPYNGKKPGREGSVPRYTARRARLDGCDPRPRTTHPRAHVTRIAYRGCDAGFRVELLRLAGTDHGWPGAGPPLPDHNPSGVSATRELVRFVRAARRPAS
jgi:polyhydroxybutyrate depolymerase